MLARLTLLAALLSTSSAFAQLSPPGMGSATTAAWLAVGLRQELDAGRRRHAVSYVGVGTVSHGHDDYDPLRAPAIVVLNHEVYDQFAEHWSYSLALSYRRQHEGEGVRQEFRSYARWSHATGSNRWTLTHTLRPELRAFVGSAFEPARDVLQLRLRLRSQLRVRLDVAGTQSVLASAELLGATQRARGARGLSALTYQESRFCVYYALTRERWPFTVHVGYMNDLLGRAESREDVHYVALDVTWDNPFGRPRRRNGV